MVGVWLSDSLASYNGRFTYCNASSLCIRLQNMDFARDWLTLDCHDALDSIPEDNLLF